MRKPLIRVALAVLLLLGLAGAGVLLWDVERRAPARAAADLASRIDPLFQIVADIGLAHAGYLVGGPATAESLERVPALLRELAAGTVELSLAIDATRAEAVLPTLADATAQLAQADARARDHLLTGDRSSASHVLLGDARAALTAVRRALADLLAAELRAFTAEREAAVRRAGIGLAATGLFWIAGLAALVRLPRPIPVEEPIVVSGETPSVLPAAVRRDPVDLAAAASLCSDIARVETTDALAKQLDRATVLLKAHGAIVWVGAGEELFPVIARGYAEQVVHRLGPVSLRGENATAAAWRTQQLQVVHGTATSPSALVAPVCGPAGCVAVFAVELAGGREDEPAVRAVVTMLAAQLASLVAGWPGASVANTN